MAKTRNYQALQLEAHLRSRGYHLSIGCYEMTVWLHGDRALSLVRWTENGPWTTILLQGGCVVTPENVNRWLTR